MIFSNPSCLVSSKGVYKELWVGELLYSKYFETPSKNLKQKIHLVRVLVSLIVVFFRFLF